MLNFKAYVTLEDRLNEMRRFSGLVKYNPLFESVKMPDPMKQFFKDIGIKEQDIKFDEIKPNEENEKLISYKNENENHFQDMKIGKMLLQLNPNLSKVELERQVAKYKDGIYGGNFKDDYKFEMRTPVSEYFNYDCRSDDTTKSCMIGKNGLTSFYDDEVLPEIVQMLVLYNNKSEPIGSALIWLNDIGLDKPFVDRVYPTGSQGIVSRFNDYCEQQGWYYRHDNSLGSSNKGFGNIELKLPNYNTNQKVPYMDTLSWGHYSDGALYLNNLGHYEDENVLEFNETEGVEIKNILDMALEDVDTVLAFSILSGDHGEFEVTGETLDLAINTSDDDIVSMVVNEGAPTSEYSLDLAIETESPEIVKYVIHAGANWTDDSLDMAVNTGIAEIVSSIIEMGAKSDDISLVLDSAINMENPEIIDMIFKLGAKPDKDTLTLAVHTEDINLINRVLKHGAKSGSKTLTSAISTNDPDIIKLIISIGAKPDSKTLDTAIYYKNVELVKQVIALGAEPRYTTLKYAIKTKDINILNALSTLKLETDNESLNEAIKTKDINILKKVIELGAKPRIDSLSYAAQTGNIEVVKLVISTNPDPGYFKYDNIRNPKIFKLVYDYVTEYRENADDEYVEL